MTDDYISDRMRALFVLWRPLLPRLFGVRSEDDLLKQARAHTGPVWYHGTSEESASQILASGWLTDHTAPRRDWGVLGAGVYFGSLLEAVAYGTHIIAATLSAPLVPAADVAIALGINQSAHATLRMAANAAPARAVAQRARQLGIPAIVDTWGQRQTREVCVYDPSIIRVVGVRASIGYCMGGDFGSLLVEIMARASTTYSPLHGPSHWQAVMRAGQHLIDLGTPADPLVLQLFALLHDAARLTDDDDPEHGPRSAALARLLYGRVVHCSPTQLDLLCRAIERHDAGETTDDPTIGACWDADRLTLWRVGIEPDPCFLSTPAARRAETIAWARAQKSRPA